MSRSVDGRRSWALLLVCLGLGAVAAPGSASAESTADPLAAAIARWQERMRSAPAGDEEAKEIFAGSAPLLGQAEQALWQGKRWLALSRLALVWSNLEAADYRSGIAGELRGQMAELEREWQRLGPELAASGGGVSRPDFEGLPAAARAIGEAALAEVPVYYQSSLDYGLNTAPEYGLFYLGAARAQRDLARLVAGLANRSAAIQPLAPRAVGFEISTLRDELLTAYVPPASIDSHALFIRISALLKQAEELESAGARYGALYRLLDAKARLSRLTHPGRSISADEAARRGREIEARLGELAVDSSLAQLFVETAVFSAADPDPATKGGEIAASIFDDVLPFFLVVLGPAPPPLPERIAEATVTLVRWPYT